MNMNPDEQSEILLMEYAAGVLDDTCSLLVASYITLSPKARRYVRYCESLGGKLMEKDCAPVAMERSSLHAVLDRLETMCPENAPPPSKMPDLWAQYRLPAPLASYLRDHHQNGKWHYFSPGFHYYRLGNCAGKNDMTLVRLAPGARIARHTHRGTELTLILEGGYEDEYGRYQAGELIITDETITHQPVATPEGCLSITVSNAPPRYTGALYSLLNLFTR